MIPNANQENNEFKTPENTTLAIVEDVGCRKKAKKNNQLKRINKRATLKAEILECGDHIEGSGTKPPTPKRPRFSQESMNNVDMLSVDEARGTSINIPKYMKVEGGEGCILSAFYTAGQEKN